MNRVILIAIMIVGLSPALTVFAQSPAQPPNPAPTNVPTRSIRTPLTAPSTDPNSSAFKIQVCDGPTLPDKLKIQEEEKLGRTYVPCDFNAVMLLVQHLINILMVLGVLVAIVMFTYAGWMFMSGKKDKIDKARDIFPKIFTGFIIMLSAWFIIYQILVWLTDNPAFRALLGK